MGVNDNYNKMEKVFKDLDLERKINRVTMKYQNDRIKEVLQKRKLRDIRNLEERDKS